MERNRVSLLGRTRSYGLALQEGAGVKMAQARVEISIKEGF